MTFAQTTATPTAKAQPTTAERIAALKKQREALDLRIYNLENGIETTKAKKVVPLPVAGATVYFNYGRKTATTDVRVVSGTVLAVKKDAVVEGKTTPAQVKVQFGEGFDAQIATIYPAQIVSKPALTLTEVGTND